MRNPAFGLFVLLTGVVVAAVNPIIAFALLIPLVLFAHFGNKADRKEGARAREEEERKAKQEALATLVREQLSLEAAERQRKANAPLIDVNEVFSHPARFPTSVKYRLDYVGLRGVHYEKTDITDVVFYTDNLFTCEGRVVHAVHSTYLVYDWHDRNSSSGYRLSSVDGFQVCIAVDTGGMEHEMYVNIPYSFKQTAQEVIGGYKRAGQLSPFDVFGGRLTPGVRLRAKGDLFRRLEDSKVRTDTSDNRWIQPRGLYLVCPPDQIVFP